MPGGDESRPSDRPGGGTLARDGGGTLPRAEGGGTLALLDVAGGGWLRP